MEILKKCERRHLFGKKIPHMAQNQIDLFGFLSGIVRRTQELSEKLFGIFGKSLLQPFFLPLLQKKIPISFPLRFRASRGGKSSCMRCVSALEETHRVFKLSSGRSPHCST